MKNVLSVLSDLPVMMGNRVEVLPATCDSNTKAFRRRDEVHFLDGSRPDREAHLESQRRPAVGRGFPVCRSHWGVADTTEIPPFPGPNNFNLTNRSTTPASTRLSLKAERLGVPNDRSTARPGRTHPLHTLEKIEPPWWHRPPSLEAWPPLLGPGRDTKVSSLPTQRAARSSPPRRHRPGGMGSGLAGRNSRKS